MKKRISVLLILFAAFSTMIFALPQKAEAAAPTVKIGPGILVADGAWHTYNSNKPAIDGWTAGRYKLSTDGKTLYIDGVKYAGDKRGIYSSDSLTVVVSGTNTFNCSTTRGIGLEDSNNTLKDLTLKGDASSVLNLNCPEASSIYVNALKIESGKIKASGYVYSRANYTQSGGEIIASDTLHSAKDINASGGTITATKKIKVDGSMNVSGANVTASTQGVNVEGDLYVSKGTLTGKHTSDGAGIYVEGNATVSGTGKVVGSTGNYFSLRVKGALTVSGGELEATNKAGKETELGITGYDNILTQNIVITGGTINAKAEGIIGDAMVVEEKITIKGGTVNATSKEDRALVVSDINISGGIINANGKGSGVASKNMIISGGYVRGETTNFIGVGVSGRFEMTGGKLTGKASPDMNGVGIMINAQNGGLSVADDIWISTPSEGYSTLPSSTNHLEVFNSDGARAKEATLQKVTDISARSGPTTQMFKGDYFKPDGIAVDVTFEDGSKSVLPYNYNTRDLFSFNISTNEALSAGVKSLNISCLTKTATTSFTVKELSAPFIEGAASDNTVRLLWKPVEGADSYYVYAKTEDESDFRIIGMVEDKKEYTDKNLSPGTTKEYYVIARRRSTSGRTITSENSNTLRFTGELLAPEIEVVRTGYNRVNLSWNESIGAEDYIIYRIYRADESGEYILVDTVKENEFTDKDLTTGVTYTYYVVAAIESKNLYSPDSNVVSATPAFTGKPTLTVSNNKKNYDLSWTAVDGATGYEVWRGSDKNGSRSRIASVENTSYKDTSASCYATYNYVVKAYRVVDGQKFYASDSAKVVSKPIIKESFTDKEIDKAPVDKTIKKISKISTTAIPSKKSMRIDFEKVSGAYDYRIEYRKRGEKKWKKRWTGKKNSFTITGMKNGQFLEFRFAAYKYKDGKLRRGAYSTTSYRWYVKTTAKVKAGKKSVTVKMKKYKGATGYKVFYADVKTPNKIKSKQSSKNNIKITGLKKGHTYIIRYRPIKKIGGHIYQGMAVEKKVKVVK